MVLPRAIYNSSITTPKRQVINRLMLVAVIFGVVCRAGQYLANTSLWHDEAFIALNVMHKSFAGLLGPLEWNESSPPGFLIFEKMAHSFLGRSEYALRAIPFAVGIAGVIAFARLACGLCSTPVAALWATFLMAGSAKLIVQSNEVKHFTLDFLFSVLITGLTIRIHAERSPHRLLCCWGILGAAGLWFSFASLFVFAASALLLTRASPKWPRPAQGAFFAGILMMLISCGFLWRPIHAQLTGKLHDFWLQAFPPDTNFLRFVYWFGRSHLNLFDYFWQPYGLALLALSITGGALWWRRGRRAELLLLALPVSLAFAASFLHRWPYGGNQHMTFASPAIFILTAEGLEALRQRLVCAQPWAALLLIGLLFVPRVAEAGYHVPFPRRRHEVRPVVEFVLRHFQAGDQLLVYCPAEFEFYAGQKPGNVLQSDVASARVWFVATRSKYHGRFPAQDTLHGLDQQRPRLLAIEEYGAAAYLFGQGNASDVVEKKMR